MAKILMIIAQNNFRDEELTIPKKILEEAGNECAVSSTSKAECKGMLGMKVMPDVAVKDAKADDYAAIIIVGGKGSPELANNKEAIAIIKKFSEQEKVIGAICLGPVVLAKAGILNGKNAAVFATPDSLKIFSENKIKYAKKDIVTDGNIVTASGPQAAEEFGRKIAEML